MLRPSNNYGTSLEVNTSVEGETIEQKIDGIINNGEDIDEGADLMYFDRQEGVRPETDVRTDRWEVALGATDHATKTHMAKREEREKAKNGKQGHKEGESPTEGGKDSATPEPAN